MTYMRVYSVAFIATAIFAVAGSWTEAFAALPQAKGVLRNNKPLVTFIELGSVKCIPCQKMQPVMKSIGDKYGTQVNVLFYDVWKSEQRHYAGRYGIRVIPTQVFLDRDGKEFFRHEGYFPEAEIDKLLQKRGLEIRAGK